MQPAFGSTLNTNPIACLAIVNMSRIEVEAELNKAETPAYLSPDNCSSRGIELFSPPRFSFGFLLTCWG